MGNPKSDESPGPEVVVLLTLDKRTSGDTEGAGPDMGGFQLGAISTTSNLVKVHQTGESSRFPGSPCIPASWFP